MFYRFLFPDHFRGKMASFLILVLRLFLGVMILIHGVDKLTNFNELSETFPDIMGLGSYTSLMIAVFAEFCCSLFLLCGLLVRVTVIPLILTMAVAFFDVHDADFPGGELSFIYLALLIILYFTGPGRYSVDYLIDMRLQKDKDDIDESLPES
ncbi:MAG: DoxX family protein [Bacteroidales bacterium]|nr:DoxX family protein [Bacteroidales bacterium]